MNPLDRPPCLRHAPAAWVLLGAVAWLCAPAAAAPSPGADPESASAAPVSSVTASGEIDWAKARRFWAFTPPVDPAPPVVSGAGRAWVRDPLDRFVLARLEAGGLRPAPEADRLTLVRRLSYVLTGLPPSPSEVAAFVNDPGPGAYRRLVDRVLASPHFGERMASAWLTVARYAEDQAHQVGSDTKYFYPNAHRYRAWVIDAFNHDLPYDAFVRYQLAADHYGEAGRAHLPALGFVGLGPQYYNRKRLEVMADEWEDRVDTVTRGFLGLTVACARCHDHPYDPITAEDYAALAGVFASTELVREAFPLRGSWSEDDAAAGTQDASPGAAGESGGEAGGGGGKKAKKGKAEVPPDALHRVRDGDGRDLPVYHRGDVGRPGADVPRRFLRVLCEGDPEPFLAEGEKGSGRLQLAEVVADADNPLAARVMVNRIWMAAFGQPLVATPSNFGRYGERPTHPGLLDHLATRFADGGWSVKRLLRDLVCSATFRQSSVAADPRWRETDPDNRLLSHLGRRRMTAEMLRDSLLAASGELRTGPGGRSLRLDDPGNTHRTVYGYVSRLELDAFLAQFDYPDANVHSARRSGTTTPTQKLYLLNSPFVLGRAEVVARRCTGRPPREALGETYLRLLGRPPSDAEAERALDFVADGRDEGRWTRLVQALFASNAFLYID